MKKLSIWLAGLGLCFVLGIFTGCTPKPAASADPVIASVNGDPITAKDLKRELALRFKQNPSFKVTPETLHDELDIMIDRKLLIQEAMRRKITEEENFAAAIRTFWEQTLVRILMGRLSREFAVSTPATDAEVGDYYSKLSFKATFDVVKSDSRPALERVLADMKAGKPVEWQQKIGPVSYDELRSPALTEAFSLNAGAADIFSEGTDYYLIRLEAKNPASPPPLDSIKDKIRESLSRRKAQAAFDAWLGQKRAKADIKIEPKFSEQAA